jgi:site-specific DNA recombinase
MNALTAIYARVSSERQKEEKTIESQTSVLKEFAQAQNYVVPENWVFEDEGYSGATLARPGLERLRDLVSEGQVEIVLVHSPDRLSRRYAYQVLLLEEFSRQGIEVRFLKGNAGQTPEEQLLVQFQGMIAEYERAQITERCRRGKRHRAKTGLVNVLSGAPYGYRYLKKTEGSDSCYVIDENEAPVVRQVYQWYTEEGLSLGAIARRLTNQGVPTRRGKARWERSVVWAMLRNPAYIGRAAYGKTEPAERRRITRPLRQKGGFSKRCRANRERPREQWIEIAGAGSNLRANLRTGTRASGSESTPLDQEHPRDYFAPRSAGMRRVRLRALSNLDAHQQAPSQILSVSGLRSLAAIDENTMHVSSYSCGGCGRGGMDPGKATS